MGARSSALRATAVHESRRTTKLYDRTANEVTVEDIEKIGIRGLFFWKLWG